MKLAPRLKNDYLGTSPRAAIAGLNGKELRGNLLRVNEERPKDDKKGGRPGGPRR